MSTNGWIVLACVILLGVANALGLIVILYSLGEIRRMLRRLGA